MIEVVEPGPLTTVQDAGRHGYAALGVPRSGAFDQSAYAAANRLVGNASGAAALEVAFGGLALRLHTAVTLALTGAPCPGLDPYEPRTFRAGTVLRLGVPLYGLRSYLAVRGGIDVPSELGSRSTDTLSGLGPAPLRAGDVLPIGSSVGGRVADTAGQPPGPPRALRLIPGPRDDWFTADALARLLTATWRVRPESDRVGVRLDGPRLTRARPGELPSEPMLPGAIQVPPDGRPIVFGPDSPVTGGYPVIAVLVASDLDEAARRRPGDPMTFTAVHAPRR